MPRVRLATGDCLEQLKKLPDNSIDLIVTDPPYGLTAVDPKKPGGGSGSSGFMGKAWDAAVPSVDIWKVCLQKLKPGAFAFVLCSPRQDCLARMILNLEEAGFVTGFSMISWVYACLSSDTEVLTEDGWMSWDLLRKSALETKIAVYDPKKDQYHYEKPKAWNEYKINDTCYRIRGDSTDHIVTRNHRVAVEREGKLVCLPAKGLRAEETIPVLGSVPCVSKPSIQKIPTNRSHHVFKSVSSQSTAKAQKESGNGCAWIKNSVQHFRRQVEAVNSNSWRRRIQIKPGRAKIFFREIRKRTGDRVAKLCAVQTAVSDLQGVVTEKGSGREKAAGNILLGLVPPESSGAENDRSQPQTWNGRHKLDGRAQAQGIRGNEGRAQSGMEGRRNVLSDPRQLQRRQVCPLSPGVAEHGAEGRLRDGTPPDRGAGHWTPADTFRGGTPSEPRSNGQPGREPDAICQQPGPQVARTRPSYRTTLARVERVEYTGLVFCPTVSTGAFVARRNGHIFITGNSGFPKAANLGKLADKRAIVPCPSCDGEGMETVVTEPLPADENTEGEITEWEYQPVIRSTCERCKGTGTVKGAEREVVGAGKSGSGRAAYNGPNAGRTRDFLAGEYNHTLPATPEAKALDGAYAGWQPKPAFEPVLIVMKPLAEKTYLDQALANGHGCSWLDDGRIPTTGEDMGDPKRFHGTTGGDFLASDPANTTVSTSGRFVPNVLCSDDVLNDGRIRGSGGITHSPTRSGYGFDGHNGTNVQRPPDSGSFSRFFDLDAWFAQRIGELPEEVQRVFPNLLVAKPSKREKNAGLEVPRANHHPTCKPVKLCAYLVTLGSREGETVLDPFMGSGTTGVAAVVLNRDFIGCELDPEFVEISRRRIKHAKETGVLPGTEKPKPKKKKFEAKGLWEKR